MNDKQHAPNLRMLRPVILLVTVLLVALSAVVVFASTGGDYLLDWFTVDNGGATRVEGGTYALGGTSGQPDADSNAATGGDYSLKGGFWHARSTMAEAGGKVWLDSNFNGLLEEGETGFPNATVQLESQLRTVLSETSTDGEGVYTFADLAPGTYFIRVLLPSQYHFSVAGHDSTVDPTTGETESFTLLAGDLSLEWHAGVFPVPTADSPADEPPWWENALRTFLPAINR